MNLSLAIKVAGYSKHEKTRVGAVAYRGHRVVAHSTNRTGRAVPDYTGHAEIRALLKAQRLKESPPIETVSVARIGAAGAILDSVPCANCMRVMRAAGVYEVLCVFRGNVVTIVL